MDDTLLAEFRNTTDLALEFFAKGYLEENAKFFTEDCKFMPPGHDVCIGREDTKKGNEAIYKAGFINVTFKSMEVIQFTDDYALERCSFIIYNEEGGEKDQGKIVILWKKVDGKWLFHWSIFNSNKPSGGVTASA